MDINVLSEPFSITKLSEIVNNEDIYEYIKNNNLTIIAYKTKNDGTQCFAVNSDYLYDEKEKQKMLQPNNKEELNNIKLKIQHNKTLKDIIKHIGFNRWCEKKQLKILDFTHGNKDYKGSISQLNNDNYDIAIYNFNESQERVAPDLQEIDFNAKKTAKVFNKIMGELSEYKIEKDITFSGVSMGVEHALSKMKYIDKNKIKGEGDYKINIVANSIPSFGGYIADPYKDIAKLFIEGISGNNGEFYNHIKNIHIRNDLGGIYHTNSDAEEFLKSVYTCFQINDSITSKDFEDFKQKISVDDNLSSIKMELDNEYKKNDSDIGDKDKKIDNIKLSKSNRNKFIFIAILLSITIIGAIFILLIKKKIKEKQFELNEEMAKLLNIKYGTQYSKQDIDSYKNGKQNMNK